MNFTSALIYNGIDTKKENAHNVTESSLATHEILQNRPNISYNSITIILYSRYL
uniref:Uncharacterized protein MANES_05G119700 n=1 Tax=Rhizophora mucronata TaxID=61149 RepID=A0A2P2MHT7_RHIMU